MLCRSLLLKERVLAALFPFRGSELGRSVQCRRIGALAHLGRKSVNMQVFA